MISSEIKFVQHLEKIKHISKFREFEEEKKNLILNLYKSWKKKNPKPKTRFNKFKYSLN